MASAQTQAEYAIEQANLKNDLGLKATAIRLLATDVSRFCLLDADLPTGLLKYLVDGEDESVLVELEQLLQQKSKGINNLPYFHGGRNWESHSSAANDARYDFFNINYIENVAFYCRLARLYSSSQAIAPRYTEVFRWKQFLLDPFLETLLPRYSHYEGQRIHVLFPIQMLEQMCKEVGESLDGLAQAIYGSEPTYSAGRYIATIMGMQGFSDYTCKHAQVFRDYLMGKDASHRVYLLNVMRKYEIPVQPFLDQVIDRAISSAKGDREAAWPLLKPIATDVFPLLETRLVKGKADERLYAAQLLHHLNPEDAQGVLEKVAIADKSEKVRGAIEQLLNPTVIQSVDAPTHYELPPLLEIDLEAPLSESSWAIIDDMLSITKERLQKELEKSLNELKLVKTLIDSEKNQDQSKCDFSTVLRRLTSFLQRYGKRQEQLINRLDLVRDIPEACITVCEQLLKESFSDEYWQDRETRVKESLRVGRFDDCLSHQISISYEHGQILDRLFAKEISSRNLQLVSLLRLARLFSMKSHLSKNTIMPFLYSNTGVLTQYYRCHPELTLRDLGATLEALGIPDARTILIKDLLPTNGWIRPTPLLQWESDAIWPLFAENLEHLEICLSVKQDHDHHRANRIQRVLQILDTFPQPPARLISILWPMAFSGQPKDRLQLQTTLDRLPDSRPTIINALQDSDPQKRIIAAQWLARLQDTSVIPTLKTHLKTEKRELVRDAWMRSLERLGATVDEFLNRDGLSQEAATGLKKGIPTPLDWFPIDRLPQMHWQDSGAPVEPQILTWFLVQTHKQKNAEPSPMLRRYLGAMEKSDRLTLGQLILETWIGYDTLSKYSPAEAAKKAQAEAAQQWRQAQQWMQQNPGNATYYADHSEEKYYQNCLKSYLNTYEGSAIKDKGILALAGACCGASAVPTIASYLKTHYGQRLAQCLSLLQVLAWIEDFSAIQLLLSVSNRFRTKSIQTTATKLVTEIADRNGWTRDELADRTIPDCGFSSRDKMLLDYGPRQFTARLDSNMTFILTDDSGKILKTLPAPRKDDDEELAKLAKQQLTDGKKQLKQVLQLQQERLYEAMCTQRQWTFEAWATFLLNHPIVNRHCQRLIWLELDAENNVTTIFRALEDGSLTDVEDNEIAIDPTAAIALAHGSLLTEPQRQSWQTHLADYEIQPIFDQLSKQIYELPSDRAKDLEITDFEGHMLEAFQLRGRILKLGYSRGETQDGGCFYDYHKTFPGLGLKATIEFSGNYLPEENNTVALTRLNFSKITEQQEASYHYDSRITLDQVPIVLLSEIYEDMRSLAALGTGFDDNWEKKTW
jgi:hypothetical protein